MPLTPEQQVDLTNLTLKLFKRRRWTDISLEFPEYVASKLIREKHVTERGGTQLNFKLKTRNTGLARNTGMMAIDQTAIEDVTIDANVPWTKQTVNWSWCIDEPDFQSDPETLVEVVKVREHAAMSDMAELNEDNLWNEPTSSTDRRPMGIPFWFQKDTNTAANDGTFNGRNPTGFSGGCAGVSSTTYPRWRNWAFRYTAYTTDDLVRKIKRALVFTKFVPPVPYPELSYGEMQREIWTTYRVIEPLERLAETRNDNLGPDVARYMGEVTVGRVPIKLSHYLESNDSNDPLYGISWGSFRPFVQKGKNMRKIGPVQSPTQHDTKTIHYDTWMNYACYDRRANFVGSLATS